MAARWMDEGEEAGPVGDLTADMARLVRDLETAYGIADTEEQRALGMLGEASELAKECHAKRLQILAGVSEAIRGAMLAVDMLERHGVGGMVPRIALSRLKAELTRLQNGVL